MLGVYMLSGRLDKCGVGIDDEVFVALECVNANAF
jgi:hypothetical protein